MSSIFLSLFLSGDLVHPGTYSWNISAFQAFIFPDPDRRAAAVRQQPVRRRAPVRHLGLGPDVADPRHLRQHPGSQVRPRRKHPGGDSGSRAGCPGGLPEASEVRQCPAL